MNFMDIITIPLKNGKKSYRVLIGTGDPLRPQEFHVISRSAVLALDAVGDYCEKNKLRNLCATKEELLHLCPKDKSIDVFAESHGLTKCGINEVYLVVESVDEIPLENQVVKDNSIIQNSLVDHYENFKGLITEDDVGIATFQEWNNAVDTLYIQAKGLNAQAWDNPTELKEVAKNNQIWDILRKIYEDIIGEVNGNFLQRDTSIVCLIVAYAIKKHKPIDGENLSNQELFRLKWEHYIAREIMVQRSKSLKMIEDDKLDKNAIRSLRKREGNRFKASKKSEIKIGKGKMDFSKITYEAYKKVCSIAERPQAYKEYIDSYDVKLGESYLLYSFKKTDSQSYAETLSHVLYKLGLKSTDKGIEFLTEKLDERLRLYMYELIIAQKVIAPATAIYVRFYQEFYKTLKDVLDEKQICKTHEENCVWNEDSVLYIYKGRTSCHIRNHEFEQATAIFMGRNNSDIMLNVERCKECEKFYMSYSVYERYREKYGMILGKIKMDSVSTIGYQDIVLSEFSPLKLCGYSVNQQDGYSRTERQYIISKVIEKGILKKSEVVRYLEYFINRNGQKLSNVVALEKWKEDLDFTLKFKMSEQAEYQIEHIKKY